MAGQPASGEPQRPTALIVKDIVTGIQTLVRQELQLAQAELMAGLTTKGQAAGAAAAAAVLGLFTVGFLGLAGGAALSLVMPAWAGWLIVAGVYLVLLLGLLLYARGRAKAAPVVPQKSKARLQEDVAWAKTLIRR